MQIDPRFRLGQKVRCKQSSIEGTIVSILVSSHEPMQYGVQLPPKKDGDIGPVYTLLEQRLELVDGAEENVEPDADDKKAEEPAPKKKAKKAPAKKAESFDEDDDADDDDAKDESDDEKVVEENDSDDDDDEDDFTTPPAKKSKPKKLTLDDVNDACKALAKANGKAGRAKVLGILKKNFKTESVSELKPEQYEKAIQLMKV